jgi:hypothetical protein
MLFRISTLHAIAEGTVTVAFRRWRSLRVRPGSTFRTALGVVAVTSIAETRPEDISAADARNSGYDTREILLRELDEHREGKLYRIGLRFAGADPRIRLRDQADLEPAERDRLLQRVARLGAKGKDGQWAARTLRLIAEHPAVRAADLARMLGTEKVLFKARVRQLKELGLTESLDIGYRLSPRGRALLAALESGADRSNGRSL